LSRPRQVAVYLARALLCETKSTCQNRATISIAITQRSSVPAARSRRGSRTDAFFAELAALFACTWRARSAAELSDAIEAAAPDNPRQHSDPPRADRRGSRRAGNDRHSDISGYLDNDEVMAGISFSSPAEDPNPVCPVAFRNLDLGSGCKFH